ncbi:MAG: phosphoribosyltransferase [Leptolyngbya sp. SIOISBB]|nr:phosphoribosyltransferase [Leptolyngbya sp. SIOISBB]
MDLPKLHDRYQAGQLLADRLGAQAFSPQGWVIALPRGGVPVGYAIAQRLHWPLDVWLVRKLGVPDQPELAMGAIAAPNIQMLNSTLIQNLGITDRQIKATARAELRELQRRDRCYRGGRPLPDIQGQPVIVVDDGVATGATLQAAIAALSTFHPLSLMAAVPVAAPVSWQIISAQVDTSLCLIEPTAMESISQWYDHFDAVADATVIQLLRACRLHES